VTAAQYERLHAMHLGVRLPAGELVAAAWAGLQDTAPRAALLSLHARVENVQPDSWEDPQLAQVWGPRGAAWLIPADAVAAFTLGRLPRDPAAQARLQRIAGDALAGAPDPARRAGAPTGRFLIRWDARTTTLIPVDPPDVDPEDARRDLARRYLSWFGESMRERFAHWAGISAADAAETMRHVPPISLPPISSPAGPKPAGVRLLPMFDPYMYGRDVPAYVQRTLAGTILVDGRVAGTWGRQQHKVTVRPRFRAHIARIEEEAHTLAGPIGRPVHVRVEVQANLGPC
jgi:hypothetical protein